MQTKCKESGKCIYRREFNGNCTILSDTNFNKPCPFRKKEGSAASQSNAEPTNKAISLL